MRWTGWSGGVVARPFGRRREAAEGVEVHADVARGGIRRDARAEVREEAVGARRAHEVREREAVLLHDHGVGADAEAAGEAEQPLDAGGPGRADADRRVDAGRAHLADPRHDGVDVEAELREDHGAEALL